MQRQKTIHSEANKGKRHNQIFRKKVRRGTGRKSTYIAWMLGKLRCKPEKKEKNQR